MRRLNVRLHSTGPRALYSGGVRRGGGDLTNVVAAGLFAIVFGAVIARQLLGRGPPIWALFVAGGFGTVALGVLTPALAESVLASSAAVLLFLFALFLFAGALQNAGALEHLARWMVARTSRPEDLPVVLFVGFGLASAFLVNDALVVIGVPVLVAVAARLRVPAAPLLLTLAFSVTVGSALTPFGNPQNLLVSVDSGLRSPVATFLRYLLLPTAVNLVAGAYYLRWRFRRQLRGNGTALPRPGGPPALLPASGWKDRLSRHPVLVLFPVTILVLLTLDLTTSAVGGPEVPIWMTAGAGAVVLLLVSPDRREVARRVEWEILLLFAGLFVVVAGAVHGGLVQAAESYVALPGPTHPIAGLGEIVLTSAMGPQLVSNVPWVGLQIPVLAGAGYGGATPVAWVGLAAASTLAGNVTVLGAASNLIVVDLAERQGIGIGLRTFVRYGLPLAAFTLVVLFATLLVGL
jgi:Na+/H+ antiporter NhaD/arsenite permease-like protein